MNKIIQLGDRLLKRKEEKNFSFYIENKFLPIKYSDFKRIGKTLESHLIAENEDFRHNFLFLSNKESSQMIRNSSRINPQIQKFFQNFLQYYSLTSNDSSNIFGFSEQTALVFFDKKNHIIKPKIVLYNSKLDPKRIYCFTRRIDKSQLKIVNELNVQNTINLDFNIPLVDRLFEYQISIF